MNPLVVPVNSVKLMNNLRELVCIRSDRKFLNELKFYKEDIYIKNLRAGSKIGDLFGVSVLRSSRS